MPCAYQAFRSQCSGPRPACAAGLRLILTSFAAAGDPARPEAMTRFPRFRIWVIAGLLAATSLQCNDGSNTTAPTDLRKVDGDQQTGAAGQRLANPLVVQVTDVDGSGVSD